MAQSGRELVKAFANVIGLDPNQVTKLTLEATARDGVLVARVEMFPMISPEQEKAFFEALKANERQFQVIIEPHEA